ncbi:TolC family protein [Paracidovorax anthurii]|uniref:Protein CyaE n=1 Tax=Paracidovorax anthurii TaxID=78229 RepID=A0A328YW95_9BURK|nr:TolC family protein [Paracidovorax anthurii]RAR77999.1 outer membrane protein TolC [Paracidovorax anthurii]
MRSPSRKHCGTLVRWGLIAWGCGTGALCFAGTADATADVPAAGTLWRVDAGLAPNAPASAAMASGTQTLASLSDLALRTHPSTRAAWSSALADLADVDAARALLRPAISAVAPLALNHGSGAAAGAAAASGGAGRTFSPSAGLAWVLFDFGARAAGVEAARWRAAASQLGYDRELQTVVSGVEQAYYSLLGARRLEAALRIGVDAAHASLDVAQARHSAGLATIAETAQAEAALGQARLQLVQAGASARIANGNLANAVGVPVTTPMLLADDFTFEAPPPAPRIDDLLEAAHVSRADLLALDAQVRQGEAEVAAAQAQGLPSLALSAQVGRQWSGRGLAGATQQVALTLTIPLFDGGLASAQARAARARVDALTAQREQQRQAIDLQVWQSFQLASSGEATIASAESLLRSAQVAEDAARERYRSGVGLLLELLTAQSTAAQARVSLVQARYQAQLAMVQLGYAVGASIGPAVPAPRSSLVPRTSSPAG